MYVDALTETLSKVLPSAAYFKTDIDTNVGVLLGKFSKHKLLLSHWKIIHWN